MKTGLHKQAGFLHFWAFKMLTQSARGVTWNFRRNKKRGEKKALCPSRKTSALSWNDDLAARPMMDGRHDRACGIEEFLRWMKQTAARIVYMTEPLARRRKNSQKKKRAFNFQPVCGV